MVTVPEFLEDFRPRSNKHYALFLELLACILALTGLDNQSLLGKRSKDEYDLWIKNGIVSLDDVYYGIPQAQQPLISQIWTERQKPSYNQLILWVHTITRKVMSEDHHHIYVEFGLEEPQFGKEEAFALFYLAGFGLASEVEAAADYARAYLERYKDHPLMENNPLRRRERETTDAMRALRQQV